MRLWGSLGFLVAVTLGGRFVEPGSPAALPIALAVTLAGAAIVAFALPGREVPLQPLHALSFGLLWIAAMAYTKARVPAELLATAQGLFTATLAAGSVLGMLVWGPLYKSASGGAVFASAAVAAGLAVVLCLVFERASRRAPLSG